MKSNRNKLFTILLLCTICIKYRAQFVPADSAKSKRYFATALPVFFYTPETRFAFGASGLFFFNFKNDSINAPRSNLSLTFVYTQNKQILASLPFNIYIKNRAWHTYGELTFNHFFYNFYGVGNNVPNDFVERYGVDFPRLRLTVLKKIVPHFYAGLRYAFDRYSLFDLDSTGMLIKGDITGSQGGTISGLGAVFMYDSRDNVFYPSKGGWAELVFYHDDPKTGSTFKYNRLAFDATRFLSIGQNIFGVNFYTILSDSDLPFYQMGLLGGQRKMRGYYEGRYRDNNLLLFQAEYRRMLIGPLGFAVFGSVGQIANRPQAFNYDHWRFNYGAGIRLMVDSKQKLTLRIDVAVGNNKVLPYFTVGEAF